MATKHCTIIGVISVTDVNNVNGFYTLHRPKKSFTKPIKNPPIWLVYPLHPLSINPLIKTPNKYSSDEYTMDLVRLQR